MTHHLKSTKPAEDRVCMLRDDNGIWTDIHFDLLAPNDVFRLYEGDGTLVVQHGYSTWKATDYPVEGSIPCDPVPGGE